MRNLVHKVLILSAVSCIANSAQALPQTDVASEVEASSNWASHINAETDDASLRLDIWQIGEGAEAQTIAVLNTRGETTRVSDADCGHFKSALKAFAALPDLSPGPLNLQQRRASPVQMPGRRADAPSWRIRLPANAPDLSAVRMEIVGSQGPYAGWVNDTVEAIAACEPQDQIAG